MAPVFCFRHRYCAASLRGGELVADDGIEGVAAWTGDKEHDEHDKVDERELLDGEDFATMDNEEGNDHGEHHGDEDEALQDAEDEGKGADDLGKDYHPEREGAAQTKRVGKEVGQGGMGHQLVVAVGEKQDSKEDTHDEDEHRVGHAVVIVEGEDESLEGHRREGFGC